ncbi:3-deoxy-D-manno-octulosonic acid transferase [Anaeromyxobacter sp. PSR-1]|uniref:3-deoxy-D-manno-octulosonic acid transferase n=1 Tax=unclassified Anaeromyxobacter TaxID=2620896 RepID=UPI0005E03A20|nr:3-deoxy-D-manno-octulosonic acid transferase [Anaeromyxobacter sp. PSR-1]GAO02375.1 3-deoxy-D-manno-octulosonic acid transferase [Anaeromyxobacter sp. PSR-1]
MHLVYAIATYLLFVIGLPFLLTHPKLRHGIPQRLGLYKRSLDRGRGSPRIWLHGASAGDLLSLQPMMAELKARMPGCCVIVSTMTNSGLAMARKKLGGLADVVVYAPYDLPGATRRAVRALEPDLLVLEYTEIWPNLIRSAHKAGVRIALTNGRFNPENLSRYRALFLAIGNPLRRIDCFLMRSDEEAERVLALGAAPDRVWVTGNTKFDALVLDAAEGGKAEALRAEMGLHAGAPVLMAGSTHEGEEELILEAYRKLLARHPRLQLVVAPRYVERSGRIMALAAEAGLSVRLRSGGAAAGHAQVTVLDTIGELAAAYGLATLVFVGGSFVTRGGQNVLEPAAQGRPVLFGPHMENFKDSVQVLQGRGGIQVATPEKLLKVADELLSRPDQLQELGALARRSVGAIRGASARNVDHMLSILPRGKVAAA